MKLLLITILVTTVNGQWLIHNQTTINTTYYGYPPGVVRNQPGGFINPQQHQPAYGFVRNATGYNNTFATKKNSGNLEVGRAEPGDVILFKEYYAKPSRWLQIREKIIEYPLYPTTVKNRITAVHAIDLSKTPGGHANILNGGIGYSYVSIRLFSERSKGFNYLLIIYGRSY